MIVDKDSLIPNSLGIAAKASFVLHIKSKEDVEEIDNFAKREDLPLLVLGEGTNILPNNQLKTVVVVLDIKGIEEKDGEVQIGAGEKWDDVVSFAVSKNLSGIESLSAIPGKTGAAPVQNIGAYGSEIKDTLESVEVFDREKSEFVTLKNKECEFDYRNSLFKKNPGRFIILSITLKLSKEKPKIPDYKDVKKYFEERKNSSPSLIEIREAIIEIRKNKLPDPSLIPNAGSFFKNPFIGAEKANELKTKYPEIPLFPAENKKVTLLHDREECLLFKVPAGWLIEKAGFKGKVLGNGKVKVYENNALVLTNFSSASFSDLNLAKSQIQQKVFEMFGIDLEPEVNIIT